jgi:hypothetical protein
MANEEQVLEITQNGQYKNINLKPKLNKGIAGLKDSNYIIVTKTFAEGREVETKYGISYSCGVKYKGEDVSFWLNANEHEVYKSIGGIDDKVKITLYKEPFVNPKTGVEMLISRLKFERA